MMKRFEITKNFIKENIPILVILLMLLSYLGFKALNENGWDGWGFGSTQTLMSSQYWAQDGFIKNYLLFIPRPYSKLIHYFDEPEFRNRVIDDVGGALKRNRIYYTHYPPLYLVPFAMLAKIGVENRAILRIFSMLISLSALFLFYLFIQSLSGRKVAIIASAYYGLSVTFLNYADSISIQPFTIFFTFLILYLSVLAGRLPAQAGNLENQKNYRKYTLAVWVSYFALSLSSYDATFFVFAWLVLYDVITLKKLLWRKWLFWASAPLLGFVLQILQNVWYLGLTNAAGDIYTSYTVRAIGSLKGFTVGLITPFVSMTSFKTVFIFKKTIVALTGAAAIFGILWKFKQNIGLDFNYFKIILILAIAAILQPFFINVTGLWPYQGVLTAPFWGLLIGVSTIFIIKKLKEKEWSVLKMPFFIMLTGVMLLLWSMQLYSTFVYAKDWPNNKPNQQVINFSQEIKKLYPNGEKIAFRIIPQNPIWKSSFPTFNMEYYMGMPTIDFANTKDLTVDFRWFQNRSKYPFYSFIISENKSDILKISKEIGIQGNIRTIQDQFVLVIPPQK